MNSIDWQSLRAEIKARLDRETTAELLSFIGIEITRDWRFKDDPSFSIRRDGYIKDFGGTGFCGDIVAFLHEQQGQTLPDATKWVADALGVDYECY